MEFGLRRAQGPDAGIYGARAAMIGGCIGTSNVLTGKMFDVPVKGTHAHSWIMSFPDEYTAFKTYANLYPDACILLVDTYDVLESGVPNAIRVFQEMKAEGRSMKGYGIRIDSGDLAYLSKKAYEMLNAAGFGDAVISASSDLDEYLIDSLKTQGAKINSWGVGTNLITCGDWPAFGGVYKLAAVKNKEHEEFTPKIKLSENSKKAYEMLNAAGFGDAVISASSDLDEYLIDSLKTQGAKINSWGVGTNLITCGDWPAFGGVYKLAAVKNKENEEFTPKIKLSENSEKVTNPGNKTIFRIYDKETGKIRADLICLADETFDESKDLIIFDPIETWKKTKIKGGTYTLRELLVPIFKKGMCVYESPSVMEIRDICTKEKATLWEESLRLVNPHEVYVDLSDKLYKIKTELLEEMSKKALDMQ